MKNQCNGCQASLHVTRYMCLRCQFDYCDECIVANPLNVRNCFVDHSKNQCSLRRNEYNLSLYVSLCVCMCTRIQLRTAAHGGAGNGLREHIDFRFAQSASSGSSPSTSSTKASSSSSTSKLTEDMRNCFDSGISLPIVSRKFRIIFFFTISISRINNNNNNWIRCWRIRAICCVSSLRFRGVFFLSSFVWFRARRLMSNTISKSHLSILSSLSLSN